MRVALVSDWAPPRIGGVERQMAELSLALRANGHDARIITTTPGPAAIEGIPVHRLDGPVPPGWRRMQRALDRFGLAVFDPVPRRTSSALRRILVGERVEVVHGHSLWSALAHVAMKLGRDNGIATVLTNHSVLERGAILFFRGFSGVEPWHEWPSAITAVSAQAARDAERASRRPVTIVPNGIVARSWSRAPRTAGTAPADLRPGRRRIVSVLRLNARKAPHTLLDALASVRLRLDGRSPRLDVYGDGPLLPALRRRALELDLDSLVTFHGARAAREVAAALATADLFVLPGAREAFGIAALEALAAGVPVVALRSSATHVFGDGVCGLAAEDVRELGDRIARLVTDEALRARLASGAPLRAASFDWTHVAPLYLDVYRRAVAS